MRHVIFSYIKTYQDKLDRSLSLRSQLEKHKEGTDGYQEIFKKLVSTELECQELDYKIYWYYRSIKNFDTTFEYYNHLKYNQ